MSAPRLVINKNVAERVLARYWELETLARKTFLGNALECDGGDGCPWRRPGHATMPVQAITTFPAPAPNFTLHHHYPNAHQFTESELQERIRTLAVITEEVAELEAEPGAPA